MENNNELLNEVQTEEILNDGIQIIGEEVIDESSDFTKNLMLIGAGALIAITPLIYKKVLKPGAKKLFGKKNSQSSTTITTEYTEVISQDESEE